MDKTEKLAFSQMRELYLQDKDTLRDVFLEMGHDEMTEILLGAMAFTCQGFSVDLRDNAEFTDEMSIVAVTHSKFSNQFKFVVEGSTHGAPTSFLIRMLTESAVIARDMAEACNKLILIVNKLESAKGGKR